MGTHTKTTLWGFATDTADVGDATNRDLAQRTIEVDHAGATFRSAIVEVFFEDYVTATGGTITSMAIGCSVAGASYTTVTEADDLTHSAENLSAIYKADFTAHFNSNFGAGNTATVDIRVNVDQSTGTTLGTRNVCALLYLTYDCEDTDTDCVKTVTIPLESPVGALSTSGLAEIGTNQVPILTGASGVLKEVSSPTILDYFFILEGNENANAGTTDLTLEVALDSDSATAFGVEERALSSDRFYRNIWSKIASVPTTTSVHAFKAQCAADTSHHHMAIKLCVTYKYTRANAAALNTSIAIPFYLADPGATTSGDQQVIRISIDIQEPGTITLQQSAVQFYWMLSGAMTSADYISFQMGSQTARTYTSNVAAGSLCGAQSMAQRIDSGAAGGAGITLARGMNYLDVKVFCDSQVAVGAITGMLYLNYTSDVPTGGVEAGNRTAWFSIADTNLVLNAMYTEVSSVAMATIAETNYWVNCAGLWGILLHSGTTPPARYTIQLENLSGEGINGLGDGWADALVHRSMIQAYPDEGIYFLGTCLRDLFKRHPGDPATGQRGIEDARKWRVVSNRPCLALSACVTYHAITWTVSGAVSGYAGTGAVTAKVHDDASGDHLYTVTASAGGSYSATVYAGGADANDATARYHFTSVYEDDNHTSRSPKWRAY